MARPTKLTAKTRTTICEALRTGMTRVGAAGLARLTYTSFANWYKEGERASVLLETGAALNADQERYFEFFTAVNEAEAQVELDFITIIYNAAMDTDPNQAWKWLERRRRLDYGTGAGSDQEDKGTVRLTVEYVNKREDTAARTT